MTLLQKLALVTMPFLVVACDRVTERMDIVESRPLSKHARPPQTDIPSKVRFYDDSQENKGSSDHPLVWTTPVGWTEGQPSQMRLIDLKFGPNSEGECYLSALPGPAGGVEANLNRWGQLGLDPLSAADIEKLPRRSFMGDDAYYLVADGDYRNIGQEQASQDYRMVGLLQATPDLTLFVKMTGPRALVEANMAGFDSFISSIGFRSRSTASE
jgi:hypothetical protein